MDLGFVPGEGTSGLVVVVDEGIDVCPEVSDAGEAGALQRLATEDREPALNLIEPGGVGRREVEVNVLVPGKPAIAFGLADDMDLASAMHGDDAVHEVEEFYAASTLVVADGDLAIRLAMLKAANSVEVRCRVYSCARPLTARPFGSFR